MYTNTDIAARPRGSKPERHHTETYLRSRTPKPCQGHRKARAQAASK